MERTSLVTLLFCILHVQAHHICTESYWDLNHGNICYWIISTKQNATESDEICKANDGKLAFIPNQDALNVVSAIMDAKSCTGLAYIGYRKFDSSSLEIQGTGQLQSWSEWDVGQPGGNDEECIGLLASTNRWHDFNCSQVTRAVCSTPFVPANVPTTETTAAGVVTTEITASVATTESTAVFTNEATTVIHTTTCHCDCNDNPSFDINPVINITKELQEKLDALKKETEVNEEMLSSTIRKRTSVSDPRPSSAYVGYLGIGLLTLIFGGLFLLDLSRVIIVFKALF